MTGMCCKIICVGPILCSIAMVIVGGKICTAYLGVTRSCILEAVSYRANVLQHRTTTAIGFHGLRAMSFILAHIVAHIILSSHSASSLDTSYSVRTRNI